jgi:hypothetical protein
LRQLLSQAGIQYQWFPALGNPDRYNPDMHQFRRLMAEQGEHLMQPLRTCMQIETICVLCAEKEVQRCHRRLIAAYLLADGCMPTICSMHRCRRVALAAYNLEIMLNGLFGQPDFAFAPLIIEGQKYV